MTLQAAMERFLEAANTAIHESDAVRSAWADLKACGVIDGSLEILAHLHYAVANANANADQDFLRQLRITPDLEVRE